MTDKKGNIILKVVFSFLVAGVLLYFCFRGVNWSDFAAGLKGCRWPFAILSMIIGAGAFLFRGLRWRQLCAPLDPSTKALTTYNAVCVGNIANFVAPYLGELVRLSIVTGRSRKSPEGKPVLGADKVLGTMALERLLDVLSLGLLLLLLLVFKWNEFGTFFSEKIFVGSKASTALLTAGAILLAGFALVVFLACRLKEKSRFFARIHGFLLGLLDGFRSFLGMDRKGLFVLYTLLIWACYWFQIVLALSAMPALASLGLADALFLMLAGSLASVAPVPGGFGAFHYVIALALSSLYGFPWELGMAFAVLAHETQALAMIITGGASYVSEMIRKK
ncbi:MAG: flippase-like domain-containing protein [Bacteroidales bacterium]|nr:flippase-like domain-containing protein [Bacteroidales bacterium]